MLDSNFLSRQNPLNIYGSKQTLSSLREHIFNNEIWPDFSKIDLLNKKAKSLIYNELKEDEIINIQNHSIKAIKANHIDGALGFVVKKDDEAFLLSGDTHSNNKIAEILNTDLSIKVLLIECSFPNELENIATLSRHLTPNLLHKMLQNLKRDDLKIYLYHLKCSYKEQIKEQVEELNILKNGGKILEDYDFIDIKNQKVTKSINDFEIFDRIMQINLKLSSQQDRVELYDMTLTLLRELTKSDAGTLYLLSEDKKYLDFKVVQNEQLDIYLGKNEPLNWTSVPLYLEDGSHNKHMVAAVCALDNKIINIADVYNSQEYDFSGTKKFDANTGYRSKSMLVIPLINHENDVMGVIQLINKDISNPNAAYDTQDEKILKALSFQAAMALTNTKLIASLEDFFESFVNSIANAIDAKSMHTSTHIKNMSKLVPLIAKSLHNDDGFYKDIAYSANDIREIELAAKLHDIGKISIPEWVIDKSTKLQKLLDGFELVKLRFEVLKRDLHIELLEGKITKQTYEQNLQKLLNDEAFLNKANQGSEFMADEYIEKIKDISKYSYNLNSQKTALLDDDEIYNLSIKKGTLTNEEREIMNSHAKLSYDMLKELTFPKKFSNVMHIAVNHHEKLNAKGYPRGLGADELVLEDRILILADIFEALSSSDRPYKKAKPLSEIFKILDFMAKDGEIDKDLLEFFKHSDALKIYAKERLREEQFDV